MTRPTISLIISTYNRPDTLELVLMSVLKQSVLPKEVIIADDGSTSETAKLIQSFQKQFSTPLIHSWIEDKGFRLAKSRNEAIKKSSADFLVFIDGDIIIHKHFIKNYQKRATEGTYFMGSRALLSETYTTQLLNTKSILINPCNKGVSNKLNSLYIPIFYKLVKGSQSPLKSVKGANMGIWKVDLQAINGFDERFTGWGREDSDMAARLMNLGIKRVNFKGAAVCYHLYHPENDRSHLLANDKLLQEVMLEKRIKALKGLDND